MSWGILEMLGSVTVLMVAIPPVLAGVGLLFGGELAVGAVLVAAGFGMVAADQYITTPRDLPVVVASKVIGVIAEQPDDEQ